MPKSAKSCSALIRQWISNFPKGIYTTETDGKFVFCQICDQKVIKIATEQPTTTKTTIKVPCSMYSQLKQHNDTAKHQENAAKHRQGNKQKFISSFSNNNIDNTFFQDLCAAFIGANIPFYKINNQLFKNFLEKYTGRHMPDESTLRKNYLGFCYKLTIERMKQDIGDSFVWISVDETTDPLGRYAANLLVGKLEPNGFQPPKLIAVKMLDHTNHSTVSRFVNNGLRDFGIREEKVLLLVTDAAKYMLKAGRVLSVFYPHITHVTCIAHALNRICDEIRLQFPDVDELISNTKKVFTKAASRVKVYKETCPNLPLPPQPVLTRWTTWMKAAEFYNQNFFEIKMVVDGFDPKDAASIQKSQNAFINPAANFSFLSSSITKLESQGLTLAQTLDILSGVKTSIYKAEGIVAKKIQIKLDKVLDGNPGLEKLIDIAKVLSGDRAELEMAPAMMSAMKYAPMTSTDVERSFSIYGG